MICLSSCSRKMVPFTYGMAQDLYEKGNLDKIWLHSDMYGSTKFTYESDITQKYTLGKKGKTIDLTISGMADEINLPANTIGGAQNIQSPWQFSMKYEKNDNILIPYKADSSSRDSKFYLDYENSYTNTYSYARPGLCVNTGFGTFNRPAMSYTYNVTTYDVELSDGTNTLLYKASSQNVLYVNKREFNKVKRTSKTLKGYKPGT